MFSSTGRTTALNRWFLSHGLRHSAGLKLWFSFGAVLGTVSLLLSVLVLVWQTVLSLSKVFASAGSSRQLNSIVSPIIPGFTVPWIDAFYVFSATSLAVAFHEFGHALAAGSEGVPVHHIAVFCLGAYVALSVDALELLSPVRLLRIYCAGVWHNAVLCVACWLLLKLLPLLFVPLFIHGVGPVVTGVHPRSPLVGHLHARDTLKGIDGIPVYSSRDWHQHLYDASKDLPGYCVPLDMSGSSCKPGMLRFPSKRDCFNASQIVACRRCKTSSPSCSQMEECMEPELDDGETLVRISVASSGNSSCERMPPQVFVAGSCEKVVVFAGLPRALEASVDVTDYQPRYKLVHSMVAWLPSVVERFMAYIFGISAALATLNSAPVFYLDGEEILLSLLKLRGRRKRHNKVLRACLVAGTGMLAFVIGSALYTL